MKMLNVRVLKGRGVSMFSNRWPHILPMLRATSPSHQLGWGRQCEDGELKMRRMHSEFMHDMKAG
jgi:hypothetical protein